MTNHQCVFVAVAFLCWLFCCFWILLHDRSLVCSYNVFRSVLLLLISFRFGVILRSGRAPGGTFIFDPQASHPPQPAAGADFFERFFLFSREIPLRF